jgi:chromate transporter
MLALFGSGMIRIELDKYLSVLHGLKLVAVAVVAQAVWGMAKRLCPDRERIVIAVVSCAFVFILAGPLVQIGVLLVAGLVGSCWLRIPTKLPAESATQKGTKRGVFFLFMFFGLLVALPGLRSLGHSARLFDSFYRSGALVFGGGHVVLPMLRTEVVPPGWVSSDLFMVGYGLAHAIPGPLFTFSAYLGAVSSQKPNGWVGASIALIAMFLPAFLLIVGVLPFWSKLRSFSKVRQAMAGVNAAVVGILLASFFSPVWTSAIFSFQDLGLAVVGFLMLETRGLPSWAMVLFMVGLSFAAQ